MPSRANRSRPHSRGPGLAVGPKCGGARVSGRVWVAKGGETFLSWGRVTLLERIRETGSISAAARSMGMGYRHAWDLVDGMNRLSPVRLVERAVGGRGGGGARLTPHGEAAVGNFWRLVRHFGAWLGGQGAALWEEPPEGRAGGRRRKSRRKA